jgi:hypothetical protein
MYTIVVLLSFLWVLGELCHFTFGGGIHALLIAAVILVLIKLGSNRRKDIISKERARARQRGRDLDAPKTWHLK